MGSGLEVELRNCVVDLSGRLIGIWRVMSFSHTKERSSCGKVRKRHYWLGKCTNCGSERKLEEHNMLPPAGGKCQNCWGNPQGHSGFKELLDSYNRNARKLKREFLLTEQEFKDITSKHCYYCNCPPLQIKCNKRLKTKWGAYLYNGIDRINNDVGYLLPNCVPCCVICNRAKNNMSYVDFMAYINRIKGNNEKLH